MVKLRNIKLYIFLISCISSAFLTGHGFIAGTLISTPDGFVPIEQIKENDLIISRNKVTNTFEHKPVKACAKQTVHQLIKISIGATPVFASPEQRFYLAKDKKWILAKDLKVGQQLLQNGGGSVAITDLKDLEKEVDTYELSIHDCHNFCASDKDVVTHNFIPGILLACTTAAESTMVETALVTTVDCIWGIFATKAVAESFAGEKTVDQFLAAVGEAITSLLPWGSSTPSQPRKRDSSRDISNFDPKSPNAASILKHWVPGQVISNGPITYVDESGKFTASGTAVIALDYTTHPEQLPPAPNNHKTVSVYAGSPQPSDPNDPKNNKGASWNLQNNPKDKSGPKVKPRTAPTREQTHSVTFDTYEQARNEGLRIIGKVDQATAIPVRSDVQGICCDKLVGTRWHGHEVTMRLDHDPNTGPHINITDYRGGKGSDGVSIKIPFKGDEKTVQSLLKPLNTPANNSMASTLGVPQAFDILKKVGDASKVIKNTTEVATDAVESTKTVVNVVKLDKLTNANPGNLMDNLVKKTGGFGGLGGLMSFATIFIK